MPPIVGALLGLVGIAAACFAYYRGVRSGRITDQRLRSASWSALLLSFAALACFLFIIAPRVPGHLKDGLFGGAGGLVMVTLALTALHAAALLARLPKPNRGDT